MHLTGSLVFSDWFLAGSLVTTAFATTRPHTLMPAGGIGPVPGAVQPADRPGAQPAAASAGASAGWLLDRLVRRLRLRVPVPHRWVPAVLQGCRGTCGCLRCCLLAGGRSWETQGRLGYCRHLRLHTLQTMSIIWCRQAGRDLGGDWRRLRPPVFRLRGSGPSRTWT